jgi:uncharacterized Ntn-hydrolase superfamily protein
MRASQDRAQSGPARIALAVLGIALLTAVPPAHATYSIAAVDLDSGHAGGAGTSCVGSNLSVYEIFGAAPGFGVVMAQAALNRDARDRAVELLLSGSGAEAVLAEITGTDFDFAASVRQYAVVDARGVAVGFTGVDTMPHADDVQGRAGEVVYSVQGNILTGAAVLEQAAAVFAAPGCDLADTLMRALAAGAENEQGDRRCTSDGIPSDGAFIRVDLADGDEDAPYLELQVDDTAPEDPIAALRALYDEWRGEHPCPAPQPDAGMQAGSGGQSGGSGGQSGGSGGQSGGGGAQDAGAAGMSANGPPRDASVGAPGGSGAAAAAGGSAGAGGPASGADATGGVGGLGGSTGAETLSGGRGGGSSGGCAAVAMPGASDGGVPLALACAGLLLATVRLRLRRRPAATRREIAG